MNSQPIRQGSVNVKEEGLRSFLWSKKWMVLREGTLGLHKNEVRTDGLFKRGEKDYERF
jgi:serine/threonine-protein kinase CLA4